MYLEYFNLNRFPFPNAADTDHFFVNGKRNITLNALKYIIINEEGLTTVAGDVGVGKSTLLRKLVKVLPDNVNSVVIYDPRLSPIGLLTTITTQLKLNIHDSTNILAIRENLIACLKQKQQEGQRTVILLDETQYLTEDVFEEIHLLSNLEHNEKRMIQWVLFGQSDMESYFSGKSASPLQDRIVNRIYLNPLNFEEIDSYIQFRLGIAGYVGHSLFSRPAVQLIEKFSAGCPRRINLLAHKALMTAYSKNRLQVEACHVNDGNLEISNIIPETSQDCLDTPVVTQGNMDFKKQIPKSNLQPNYQWLYVAAGITMVTIGAVSWGTYGIPLTEIVTRGDTVVASISSKQGVASLEDHNYQDKNAELKAEVVPEIESKHNDVDIELFTSKNFTATSSNNNNLEPATKSTPKKRYVDSQGIFAKNLIQDSTAGISPKIKEKIDHNSKTTSPITISQNDDKLLKQNVISGNSSPQYNSNFASNSSKIEFKQESFKLSAEQKQLRKVAVNAPFLNVRDKPNGKIISKLPNGKVVKSFETKSGWTRIKFVKISQEKAANGWVYSKLLNTINTTASTSKFPSYAVQVGGFKNEQRAERLLLELSNKGYNASITEMKNSKGLLWNYIWIGRFDKYSEAVLVSNAYQEKEGKPSFVMKIPTKQV
jgi:MSHA biogenesis protein MshM